MKPTDIAAPDYFHKVVDCQWACPAHTPVPEYIRLIAAGRYSEAYMVNWEGPVGEDLWLGVAVVDPVVVVGAEGHEVVEVGEPARRGRVRLRPGATTAGQRHARRVDRSRERRVAVRFSTRTAMVAAVSVATHPKTL